MENKLKIPSHIAFIMDGNGRWAKKRLLPRKAGHREGVNAMQRVVEACHKLGVKVVSFYAFSTENWSRPADEVAALLGMIDKFAATEIPKYAKRNFVLRFMGDLSRLPEQTSKALEDGVELCKNNSGTIVNIAINYGGRDEIAYACRKLVESGAEINVENICANLYTAGLPDPDLMVRSSGEVRLSNFMLWQLSYSEMIFTNTLWPDFNEDTIKEIILEYSKRDRRFGKVN